MVIYMRLFPLDLTTSTDKLKELISENPDLPIAVLATEDAVADGYCSTYCSDIRFYIDEILDCEVPYMEYVETDRVNFEEQIEEWLWDNMGGNDTNSILTEELFQETLQEVKEEFEPYWKKVILIVADNLEVKLYGRKEVCNFRNV